MGKQNQIIGDFKQFITIERRELNQLQGLADEIWTEYFYDSNYDSNYNYNSRGINNKNKSEIA